MDNNEASPMRASATAGGLFAPHPLLDRIRADFPAAKFVVVTFARGAWCPFCHTYALAWQLRQHDVKARGGVVVVVSSQEPAAIPTLWGKASSAFPEAFSLPFYVDSGASLGRFLGVVVEAPANPAVTKDYPNGMTQPGVFVLVPVASANQTISWRCVVQWTHVSKASNLYGASGRVSVQDVIDAYDAVAASDVQATTTRLTALNSTTILEVFGGMLKRLLGFAAPYS